MAKKITRKITTKMATKITAPVTKRPVALKGKSLSDEALAKLADDALMKARKCTERLPGLSAAERLRLWEESTECLVQNLCEEIFRHNLSAFVGEYEERFEEAPEYPEDQVADFVSGLDYDEQRQIVETYSKPSGKPKAKPKPKPKR